MLEKLSILSVFSPLLGALLSTLFRDENKNRFSPWICTLGLFISLISSIIVVFFHKFGESYNLVLLNWIKIEAFRAKWEIFFDSLSLTMLVIVNLISFLVHVYSHGYMHYDKNKGHFFTLLSLFTFFMLMLISAGNMLQLFFGWEGVGLASYLLIGFWYQKKAPPGAAMKAFIVNRIADIGFITAMGLIFSQVGSLEFSSIFEDINEFCVLKFYGYPAVEVIAFCLIICAMGKSAQFIFHVWLPDAMEGPTPVSALIHAATMVTAGIFLICRFSSFFELTFYAKYFLLIIGSITAFFASTVAICQKDIKKIIAYSTCSQLGYMVMACGASAYNAAMFHLVTHAFFKALLFLGAGSVIHAMSDEQNIEKMGGLRKMIPFTFICMLIGTLSITGMPFFAGEYSKDAILLSIYHNKIAFSFEWFIFAVMVVLLTSIYSWRLLFMVFFGRLKSDEHVKAHIHEAHGSMRFPMIFLCIGALCSGIIGKIWYMDQDYGFQWGKAIEVSTATLEHNFLVSYVPLLISILGGVISFFAYVLYPKISENVATKFPFLQRFLFNSWYIDKVYGLFIVRPLYKLSDFLSRIGEKVIDSFSAQGITKITFYLSQQITSISGNTMPYTISFFAIVLAAILSCYLLLPFLKILLLSIR